MFAIYAITLLMYIVASPDPDPYSRGGDQLSNPNQYNSTLTSATRGEMLISNPNEFNFILTSVILGYLYYIMLFILIIINIY